jgi:putative endopeptidase
MGTSGKTTVKTLVRSFICLLLIGLVACAESPAPLELAGPAAKLGSWGVDFDPSRSRVHPGDDFHGFVNDAWLSANPIPEDRSSWGSFAVLAEQSEHRVRDIIRQLEAVEPPEGSAGQKVSSYMRSWMDTETLNRRGLGPIQQDLARVQALSSHADLVYEFGLEPLVGSKAPFSAYVGVDPINPDAHHLSIGLAGLGLPDRDYYIDDNERFVGIRADYLRYIGQVLLKAGHPEPITAAKQVLSIETDIAKLQWSRADRRDRDKTYNPTTFEAFIGRYPDFPWMTFFGARGISSAPSVNVSHPDTLEPLMALTNEQPLDAWQAYLSFHLVNNHASLLTTELDDLSFEFWGKALSGQEQPLSRWQRGVARVGSKRGLGELMGQIYVDQHFPESSKARMEALVEDLRTAFGERIKTLPWMSEATKTEALNKLAAFEAKIGYPNRWQSLESISIDATRLFENARSIRQFFWRESVHDLNAPTDRSEWYMMPQTVNAYYMASFNQIVFPAAILEPPFFDPNADPAANYGAIGAVIGHEMGHGFDDQGSKYDAKGIKRDWWTEQDLAKFKSRTATLVEQFSGYESIPGFFIDGAYTLGENIGDLGGVEVAFDAYQRSLNGEVAPIIDGLTGEQRFFLAYAQAWRVIRREDLALRLLKSDSHSPPKYRVNGILRNIDAWYDAFDVKPEHALWLAPEERVQIW